MLGSRIVCKWKSNMLEGIVTYAEGHFIVFQAKPNDLNIEEQISCTLFEGGSVHTFQSKVIAKKHHHIIISLPAEIREKWMISRESPRFPIDIDGKISAVSFSGAKPLVELKDPYPVHIYDVSEGGLGFSSENYIREGGLSLIQFQLSNEVVHIEIEIMHHKYPVSDGRFYYGGRFKDLDSSGYQSIRSFTFNSQLKRIMTIRED